MTRLLDIKDSREYKERFIDFGIHHYANYSKSLPKVYESESALLDKGKNFFFRHGGRLKAFIII